MRLIAEEFTINTTGDYLFYVNNPIQSNSARASPKMEILKSSEGGASFNVVSSGVAMQGYIRSDTGHNISSINFSGIVTGINASDIVTIHTDLYAAAGTVNISGARSASIYIEKFDTSANVGICNDADRI